MAELKTGTRALKPASGPFYLLVALLSLPILALWVVTVDWFSSYDNKFQEDTQLSLDWGVGSQKKMILPTGATWVRKGTGSHRSGYWSCQSLTFWPVKTYVSVERSFSK